MDLSTSERALLALMAGMLLVRLFYYFKLKRDKVSDFDKSIWQFKFSSFCFALVIYFVLFQLPSGNYRSIGQTEPPDAVLRTLRENQAKIGDDIGQIHQVLTELMFVFGIYFVGVAMFVGKVQAERKKAAAKDDPRNKKPLGL